MDYHKEFVKLISSIERTKRVSDVMDDFLDLAVVAIANRFYKSAELEESYMQIIRKYTRSQASQFSQLLGITISALNDEPEQDFLGLIYEEIGEPNEELGQLFTPYIVSKATAESALTNGNLEKLMASKGYVTVLDPACGAGSLIIAFRNSMSNRGYGSDSFLATVIDIDKNCLNMAYIQLSLLGVAAEAMVGDSITKEFKMRLYTPTVFLTPKFWHLPYNKASSVDSVQPPEETKPAKQAKKVKSKKSKIADIQLNLFDESIN